jgi:hypothetical protein
MLAGVGVPDLRGSQSKGTFYTQDRAVVAQENEQLIFLETGAEITTRVIGPRNTRVSPAADTSCEVQVPRGQVGAQAGVSELAAHPPGLKFQKKAGATG